MFDQLEADIRKADAENDHTREVELTAALDAVRAQSGMVGIRLNGERYDMGNPKALVETVTQFSRPQ